MIKPKIAPEEFIKAWQDSSSYKEVADKLKSNTKLVSARAGYYRRHGVKLKEFGKFPRSLDWRKLRALADVLNARIAEKNK